MKLIRITCVTLGLLFFNSSDAFAHAQLTSSNPVAGKSIKTLPDLLWVEFDGNLMVFGGKNPNSVIVADSLKKRVDVGGSIVGGARISTKLKPNLAPGRYVVSYRVVSQDGHPVSGSFYFTYRP